MAGADELRVGMVGYGFMGAAHSHAWRNAHCFFDLPRTPRLAAICGRKEAAVQAAAAKMGWESVETDWRRLVERPDLDLIDIVAPGDAHRDIAVAALEAGKHVLCEKPLANTLGEAEEMSEAAAKAAAEGVFAMCGFTYRRVPALALAKRLVDEGRIGTVRHVRAQYLQDWLNSPDAPLTWRLDRARAGSGALGDLGAHLIDATQWLTGAQVTGVSGILETFVRERPLVGDLVGLGGQGDTSEASPRGPVTVDDAAVFSARFSGGAVGVFETSRFAPGYKNAMRIEINGALGSLAFDLEDYNVLRFFDTSDGADVQGFRRILVTDPGHPYVGHWWPAGHTIGYDHTFVHQVVDLVESLAQGVQPTPSFADALNVQRVLDAVERSALAGSTWEAIAA